MRRLSSRAGRTRLRPALRIACLIVATGVAAAVAEAARLELAPLYGADVRSLAFDPRDPDRVLAGTSAGHVYRSDDGGSSWRDAGLAVPFPGWVVGSLLFDPERDDRVWAGLWGIWGGGSVAVSDDLGVSWTVRDEGLPVGDQVYSLVALPGSPGHLLAGTRGGVYRTVDGGESWRPAAVSAPAPDHVSSLHVDPGDPRRVLAGTWRRAWRSDDAGRSWRGAFEGMVLDSEVFAIQSVPGRVGELWAATCGWVYRGRGFGDGWERVTSGFTERRTPALLVLSPERVLAGTVAGLHVSSDGGRSFRRTSDPRLAVSALAAHPHRPERILVGTEGAGVWLSLDGGETLAPRLTGTSNLRVPALAALDSTMFAAVAHAGPLSGVYRSPDRGGSFEPSPAQLPTVLDLASAGASLFAATERGLYERAGSEWRRVGELGERRVDQLAGDGERLLARSGGAVWRLGHERRFEPVAGPSGPISSVVFVWGDAWVRSGEGLYRLPSAGGPEPASLPGTGARPLLAAGGRLLVAADDGLWSRASPGARWEPMAAGRVRALATRDPRFPLVVAAGAGLELVSGDGGDRRKLEAPFPAGDVLAALVAGDRLWVGTSGYGLWSAALPPVAEPRRADSDQTPSSEARIRR